MSDDLLTFNGVNGATGLYGLPPMTAEELARFLRGEEKPENLAELRYRSGQKDNRHFGVKEGVDPKRLDQTGWGVIFAHDVEPAVREALAPLLALRRQQAGDLFKTFETVAAQPKAQFLARNGVGPGPADPLKMPYYLLLVGSPEQIPYRFQSQLDVQYAVGRIHFDTIEEYAHYASNVVEAETRPRPATRTVALWGVENPGDRATRASARVGLVVFDHAGTANHERESPSQYGSRCELRGTQTGTRLAALLLARTFHGFSPRLLGGRGERASEATKRLRARDEVSDWTSSCD